MSYAALGTSTSARPGLGADPWSEGAAKCADLTDHDLKTKSGRERYVKDGSKCAAEAACAYFSAGAVPPGVCGPIAEEIVGPIIDVWNDLFGNAEEWEKYYRDLAQTKAFFSSYEDVQRFNLDIHIALQESVNRLIEQHALLFGPGRLGTKGTVDHAPPYNGRPRPNWPNDTAARVLLRDAGLDLYLYGAPGSSQLKAGPLFPPNLVWEWNAIIEEKGTGKSGMEAANAHVRIRMTDWIRRLLEVETIVSTNLAAFAAAATAQKSMQNKKDAQIVAGLLPQIAARTKEIKTNRRRYSALGWGLAVVGAGALVLAWRS